MKRFLVFLFFIFSISISKSQLLNTAKVLAPYNFSIGFAPAYYNHHLGFFFNCNAGLKRGVDFEIILGTTRIGNMFAGNLEWSIYNSLPINISMLTGCHLLYNNFGLDGNLNFTFRIKNDITLFTGFNMMINFGNEPWVPLWLPIGVDLEMNRTFHFIFESSIPLNVEAYPIIDVGIVIYF